MKVIQPDKNSFDKIRLLCKSDMSETSIQGVLHPDLFHYIFIMMNDQFGEENCISNFLLYDTIFKHKYLKVLLRKRKNSVIFMDISEVKSIK